MINLKRTPFGQAASISRVVWTIDRPAPAWGPGLQLTGLCADLAPAYRAGCEVDRMENSSRAAWGCEAQSALLGTTEGSGAAIEGTSIGGRGGVFKGKKASLVLQDQQFDHGVEATRLSQGLILSPFSRCICSVTGAAARAHDAGMGTITKLQKAGRTFLLRLVAEHGLAEAARMLRALADEVEGVTSPPTGRHTERAVTTAYRRR